MTRWIIVPLILVFHSSHGGSAEFERLYGELLASYWRPAVTTHGVDTTVFDYAQMTRDAQKSGSQFECPDRIAQPFTAQQLDEQLDEIIRTFFRNPGKGLRLDRNRGLLKLSWILEKDMRLFQDRPMGVLGFVLPYLEREIREWLEINPVDISYFEHDWTLNDLAQAD